MKSIAGIVIIGLGIFGTYFLSTQVHLPRRVADVLIMATLLGSLFAGNALIVFGAKKRRENSPKAPEKTEPAAESVAAE